MAYNPNSAMEKIYNFKKMWSDAAAKGDEASKNNAATKTQEYYASLRDNGYGDVANKLSASGLDQSRKYIDNWYAMSGKNAIRPYFYGKAGQYGMTNDDVDKLLSFNETTGEVSLGGKNIGRPSAISSDGNSYWDSSVLDNAWNDYVQSSGLAKNTMKSDIQQATNNLFAMGQDWNDTYKQDYNDYMNIVKQDPLTSDTAKKILAQYGLAAYTGRQNALANGAASNGGNVDSYSAANAMRQQAALNSMGQQAAAQIALDAYNSKVQAAAGSSAKLEGARQLLAQLGVNINNAVANNETMLNGEVDRSEKLAQGKFDREQTALNNDVTRNATIAGITGYVPQSYTYADNPYLDSNGNVINPDQYDFADMITKQQDLLAKATDENDKASIRQNIEWLRQAGRQKILMPQYSRYASNWAATQPMGSTRQRTEEGAFGREQLASSERMTNAGYEHEKNMANINAENQREQTTIEGQIAIDQANNASRNSINEANNATDNTIRANAAAADNAINTYNATGGGLSGTSGTSTSKNKTSATVTKSTLSSYAAMLNKEWQKRHKKDAVRQTGNENYEPTEDADEFIANTILSDSSLSVAQAQDLLKKFNIQDSTVAKIYADKHYDDRR